MRILLRAWCVLFVCGSAALAMVDDVGDWLSKLGSGSALERDEAQRWLGLNMTIADYPSLAAGARDADAETGRRLALALSSEPAHLGLALLLVGEEQKTLAGIGRSAFDDLVTRWCPKILATPAGAGDVEKALTDQMPQTFAFGGDEESIGLHVDRLERHAQFGVPVVVQAAVANRLVLAQPAQGRGLDLLEKLADAQRLSYTGIGDWDGSVPGSGAWILVSERSGARSKNGADRLLGWFRMVEAGGGLAEPAARALGRCGWAAALRWLDHRWTTRRDSNALMGVLAAATAGRASRTMHSLTTRRMLLEQADEALDFVDRISREISSGISVGGAEVLQLKRSRRDAEDIARALIGAGGLTFGGENQSRLWLENWPKLSSSQRWLRMVLIEGQRTGGTSMGEFLVGQIADPQALSPALRFQAMRALGANPSRGARPVPVGALGGLVSWSLMHAAGPELQRLLLALGVPLDVDELGGDSRARIFLMGLACMASDMNGAVQQGLALSAEVSPRLAEVWAEELERLQYICGPSWMTAMAGVVVQRANSLPEAQRMRLSHAFHVSGILVPFADNRARLKAATPDSLSLDDYQRLGSWAGTSRGKLEREFLVKAVRKQPTEGAKRRALVSALDRAHRRLLASHEDRAAESLKQSVWAACANPNSALYGVLGKTRWPTPYPVNVIDLLALERLLPGFP